MASGNDVQIRLEIAGQTVNLPVNWQDFEILASYDNDSIQPNISTSEFELVNQAYELVMSKFNSGQVFEGIPTKLILSNDANTVEVFQGYLDLTNNFTYSDVTPRLTASISKENGLNSLNDRLSALDYNFLLEKGVYTQSDYEIIEYVVEKKINLIELATSLITIYLLQKELFDGIKDIGDFTANTTAHASGGVSGGIAAAAYVIAVSIIEIAYRVAILALIIKLAKELFQAFVPPKRKTKVITERKLLEKVANYLGYSFETGISDLDNNYYLPSNKNFDEPNPLTGFIQTPQGTDLGIPNSTDAGFVCLDMFRILKDKYNAKYQIINGVLHFRTDSDPYWKNTASYVKPDVLIQTKQINSDELVSNFLLSYASDITDDWTIDEWQYTNYQRHTKLNTVSNPKLDLIKGFEEVRIPLALPSRKEKLNGFEKTLRGLFRTIDSVANFFGGNSNLVNNIDSKVGLVRMSTNNWSVPKSLVLSGGKLPSNHRDLNGAKYLMDKYYQINSFVTGEGQELKIDDLEVPLSLNNFVNLLHNGRFIDSDGQIAKSTQVVYQPAKAKASFNYRKPTIYTNNLKEEFYAPK